MLNIKDIKILELCIDGRPHVIRNIKLRPDELFTPHVDRTEEAIQIINCEKRDREGKQGNMQ